MQWILDHLDDIGYYAVQHAWLAGLPLILGLLIAIPLGWVARLNRGFYTPVVVGTGLLYTIPSLALFILMPLIVGTQILDPFNVVIAMTIYTVAVLTRAVPVRLGAVPESVVASGSAMGLGRGGRLFMVELLL